MYSLHGLADLDVHGELGLRYNDDAPGGWSFDLQITAVDLNGNESAPVGDRRGLISRRIAG